MKAIAVLSMPLARGSTKDTIALNPLDPCGACMEWLKKIAEVCRQQQRCAQTAAAVCADSSSGVRSQQQRCAQTSGVRSPSVCIG